jgi:hypothetical protein
VRRAFAGQDEEALTLWMDRQTGKTFDALLSTQALALQFFDIVQVMPP